MRIREYQSADKDACLSLFDSNIPSYFHAGERAAFLDCLESLGFLPPRLRNAGIPPGCMNVVEKGGGIVACGGWYIDGWTAFLSWGMVHRSLHGSGIGRFLLSQRIDAIRRQGKAKSIRVHTARPVQGFFERAGFVLVNDQIKGLVEEFPLVELALAIVPSD